MCGNLFQDRTRVDNLSKDSFRELLTRITSESLILFDQQFYKQHDGVFFFVIMKKFGFKIVLLNSTPLFTEDMLMILSYFFARKLTSKKSEII